MRLGRSLLLAVLVTPLLAVAPAAARDTMVASFDQTQILTHFYPVAGGGKAPTVLMGPGWSQPGDTNQSGNGDVTVGIPGIATLHNAGYNVVTWDPRGFGKSGGTVEVDSPDFEGRDVEAIIDYVAKQPEALLDAPGDPRVGMAGGSYGGGIQLVSAAIDKRIDAIVPDIAWHSLLTAQYKQQTMKTGWATLLYALGGSMGKIDPALTSAFVDGIATGKLTPADVAYFGSRGPGDLVDRIRAPTLFIQGTVDTLFSLQEAVTNYGILRHNKVPAKMLWFCGGHGVCLTNPGDTARINNDTLSWFARYLKRDKKASTGPGFEWLDQDGHSFSADSYPLPAGKPIVAQGSGTLPLVEGGGAGPILPPQGGVLGLLGSTVAPAKALLAVNVKIPTPAEQAEVVGAPQLTLTYSATALTADTRVFAQVIDDATGDVLGNQITPVPIVADGVEHTISEPLEILSATAKPGSSFTLQITPSTIAYNIQRTGGFAQFSKIRIEIPTVVPPAASRRCPARVVRLSVPERYRSSLRSARVVIDGRTVARIKRGHGSARVKLAGVPGKHRRVRLIMRLSHGRTVTSTHIYLVCS